MLDSGEKKTAIQQDRFAVAVNAGAVGDNTCGSDELPLGRAYYWEKTHGWQIFLTQPIRGRARNWRWREAMDEARRMSAFLTAQNWPAESRIVILSRNCAWWILAELAIWMSGHVTVPIYTSVTDDWARRLLDHCRPVACFLGPLDNPDL